MGQYLYLVVDFKEKQDNNEILLEQEGALHNKRVDIVFQVEMVYFSTNVDCVFLM